MKDPMYVEWRAWQLVIERFRAEIGNPNEERFNPLFRAIELWGELLVELRLTQSADDMQRIRIEKLAQALPQGWPGQ